jgi:hypothetical protein
MRRAVRRLTLTLVVVLGGAAPVRAGMPSPLPTDDELVRVFRLNETADLRLQAISFFVAGLLLCAAVVRWLWNYLARDLPLPRLSYPKAVAGVVLWGLLFVIVLTMISGARELMTPGAWRKQGFTYKLADAADATRDPDPADVRRRQLEQLRQALWHFAATHQGRFPSEGELTVVPPDLWTIPETAGLRFRYLPGRSAGQPATPLVVGPELEPGRRPVLRTDGTIADLPAADVADWLASEGRP